jgi:hypothetical protein
MLPNYLKVNIMNHLQAIQPHQKNWSDVLECLTPVEARVWAQWFASMTADEVLAMKQAQGRLGLIQGGRPGWPANSSGYLDDVLPKKKQPWQSINSTTTPTGGDAA